jgi:AAA domain-containing protein
VNPDGMRLDDLDGQQPPVITLDTVSREHVRWVWPGRLALGKLGIIDGDPGLGKSVITLDIAARVSTGTPMPGAPPTYVPESYQRGDPAGVVICCAEDDIADTIVPRLESHSADLGRIGYIPLDRDLQGRLIPLSIPRDLDRVERAILELGARLMVIDPITAYLPESVQTHNDASVRRALTPLADVAQRTGCAILLVRHLNKDSRGPAIYRGGGSIAFSGSARTALITGPHPEDPKLNVLARVKSNLSVAVASLAYRLAEDDINECVHVYWEGTVPVGADELLRGKDRRLDAPSRNEAEEMVRQILSEGPRRASEVTRLVMEGAACGKSTVTDAADKLGVIKVRIIGAEGTGKGKTTGWEWRLPDEPEPPETEAHPHPETANEGHGDGAPEHHAPEPEPLEPLEPEVGQEPPVLEQDPPTSTSGSNSLWVQEQPEPLEPEVEGYGDGSPSVLPEQGTLWAEAPQGVKHTCAKCGKHPAGPGGILCPRCKRKLTRKTTPRSRHATGPAGSGPKE